VAKAEHRQRLLDRLLEKLPAARDLAGAVALAPSLQLGADRRQARALPEDMRTLIRHAIHEIGRRGDAVIVAHAASMALTDMDGVLRVLVTASPHTRALRLAESESLDPAAAAAAVAESDGERRDYFRRFYKLEQELPTHYDLTLSTDVLTAAEAAAAIVAAARG
jgi:cytidylate kinase